MSLFNPVPTGMVLTSGVNSALTWTNAMSVSSISASTLSASALSVSTLATSSSVTASTLTTTSLNYSSIVGSSISSNTITLSLTNTSTQNTRIYQVATTNPTTSYTAVQASHVSTGTTNNALALNPSGGNVGVGTTAPAQLLDITNAASSTPAIRIQNQYSAGYVSMGSNAGVNSYIGLQAGVSTITALGTPPLVVTTDSRVGIGTTTPGTKLHVVGSGGVGSPLRLVSDVAGSEVGLGFYRNPDQTYPTAGDLWVMGTSSWGAGDRNFAIGNAGTGNVLTILANGRIGIGMTTPAAPLHVAGSGTINTANISWMTRGSGGITTSPGTTVTTVSIFAVGAIFAGDIIGCAAVTSFSDQRIKENIQLASNVFDLIRQVDIVSYDHVDVRKKSVKIGVVAQQLQPFFPEIVDKAKNWVTVPYAYATSHERQGDHVIIMVDASASELQVGRQIRLYISHNDMETQYDTDIIELTPGSITCKVWGDKYDAADRVFVYGVEVDDFLVVDKTQLGLLALAGVKEMDHTMEALQAKHDALQAKHEALQAQHDTLQSQLASLLAWAQTQGYSASS